MRKGQYTTLEECPLKVIYSVRPGLTCRQNNRLLSLANEEEKINETIKTLEEIFQPKYQHLITLFKFSPNEIFRKSVDVAILQGLLKFSEHKDKESKERDTSENYRKQLKLCLSWNQLQFAQRYILNDLNIDKV